MKLKDKFVIVTGASTGIGRAVAIALGREGATVTLVARSVEKLAETKKLVERVGGKAEMLPTDLSKIDETNKLVSKIKSLTEHVDVLANIAGIWHGENKVFADTDFEKFDQKVILDTYTVGLTAPSLLIHGLIPLMPKEARIINLSGTFESGAKGWLPYFVSKRALEDLAVGLSQELADKKIKVYGISPSDTATEEYQ